MKNKLTLRKVRWKLTLICAGTTIFILLVMSFLLLSISQKNLNNTHFLSFQNNMTAFLATIEAQTVFSHKWLADAERVGKFQVQIKDNGNDFLFNSQTENETKTLLFEYAKSYYDSRYNPVLLPSPSYHTEFHLTYEKSSYYVCIANLSREGGTLEVIVTYSTADLERLIAGQRILFLAINLAAFLVLLLFAYYFTGRLLAPIAENQKNQTNFVAAASHELRTPLAVILSLTSACKKTFPEEKNFYLDTIESEGKHMSRLVNDLLMLSHTDSHTFSIEKADWEPDTLLLNSFEAFEPMAKENGITLSISLPDEVSAPYFLDRERILQVLALLIHNALSYTPSGGRVDLSLKVFHKFLLFQVSDNGTGIADLEKENIFKRFYRVDKSHNDKNHHGLGLSIAAEIVQAHHGSIQVSDTQGGGSTFTVALPL